MSGWEEKLHTALEKWVAEKKFIEMDANPDKVAKELGTTKSLLNGYFAKHEQVSFREWRTRLRIKEAERILREEDVVLPALHELVGVSDKSNFYKHLLLQAFQAAYRHDTHRIPETTLPVRSCAALSRIGLPWMVIHLRVLPATWYFPWYLSWYF